MEKGDLLAEGRTAEVYAWGADQVLKLYRPGWERRSAEFEAGQARASQQTGFAVPAVGEVLEVEGRFGVVYQRIEGQTMLSGIMAQPWWVLGFGSQLAELHIDMHCRSATNLPSQRERLTNKISAAPHLDNVSKAAVLACLAKLPDDDQLCHGDFHPDNVMLTPNGPVIIDWIDATTGHPLGDVARTLLLLSISPISEGQPLHTVLWAMRRLLVTRYLIRYFSLSEFRRAELAAWMLPLAAARLEEGIVAEVDSLLRIVADLLAGRRCKLLPRF